MEWYYAAGDKQTGPVNDDEFKQLVTEGKVRPETLVWNRDMDRWRAYAETVAPASAPVVDPVAAASAPAVPAPTSGGICRQCGRAFPPEELAQFGDAAVCASCKPDFVQRLREGAAFQRPAGRLSESELLARDYDVNIGEAVTQGWEAFKRHAGVLIGASLVSYLVMVGGAVIPFLGVLIQLIVTGPVFGGLWLMFIKTARNEEPQFADAFSGFSSRFGSLLAAYLVPTLLTMLCMIPLVVAMLAFIIVPVIAAGRTGGPPDISGGAIAALVITSPLVMLGVLYLSIAWIFAIPLVADKGLGFWSAMNLSRRMVNKHFWMTLLLFIVCWLIMVVSMLACGVGLLVGGPVVGCAVAWHYQRVFGDLAPT